MVEMLADPQVWIALLTLCALEIVLGIDNIVFIAILSGRLPKEQQGKAYRLGMAAALITRLALLGAISWVMGLTQPLFELLGRGERRGARDRRAQRVRAAARAHVARAGTATPEPDCC